MNKLVSIVVPIHNEEKNIAPLYAQIQEVITKLEPKYQFEIIFVDDGSADNSCKELRKIKDKKVRVLAFTRNFGKEAALTCGLREAQGDLAITMDGDLQDPPSLIPRILNEAEKGVDIVYCRILRRDDGLIKRFFAWLYYLILNAISDINVPRHVGDYRCLSRPAIDLLNRCRERARYFRGLVAWTGFTHTFVDFERPNRQNGKPAYSWQKLFKLGFDGFTGFSIFPLRISAFLGLFIIITSLIMLIYLLYSIIFENVADQKFKVVVVVVYGFMGLQFVLIWLLGEYIGRIYEEQKKRPMYIVNNDE